MTVHVFHRTRRPDGWLRKVFGSTALAAYVGLVVWLALMVGFADGGWLDRLFGL